jgi:modulator of FtsH protease HflK
VKYLVGVDFFDFMSTERQVAATKIRANIEAEAKAQNLGVEILFVGLQGVHPPVKVGKDFNAVVASMQEKEAIIEAARTYSLTNVILARAEATNRVRQAESYRARRISATLAQAARFTNQIRAYTESPTVYRERSYLAALARGAASARKVVVTSTNAQGVVTLNLEDKLRPDLLDVSSEARR